MSFLKSAVVFVASLLLAAGPSLAETITFQFSGKVTYGAPMAVQPGSEIIGTFSYDTNVEPAFRNRTVVVYQIAAPHMLSATVGGHTITASNLSVSIFDHFKGNVEDMVWVSGGPMVLDGTAFESGSFGLTLASSPRNNRAVITTKLPTEYKVERFDAAGANYGTLQTDGGQTGTLLQFSLDAIVVVGVTP